MADNVLTQPAISKSGEVNSLLIEKFTGKVHAQYLVGENLQNNFDMQHVKGTNMISNKYLGETEVQTLIPGKTPDATGTEFDKNALLLDSQVIARNSVTQIDDVQNDINGLKSELSMNQTKQLKKVEDSMITQQIILGGITNTEAARTTPRVKGHGFSINTKISEAQAAESDSLLSAIELTLEQMWDQEVEEDSLKIIMPITDMAILRDAGHIVNKDYAPSVEGGKISEGFNLKSWNMRCYASRRMPKTVNSSTDRHPLSTKLNGYRYDVSAEMLLTKVLIFGPKSLLIGRSIELQSDIFWNKMNKCFYIDTWMNAGAIPDRWEHVGLVSTDGVNTNAAVTTKAINKAMRTKAVT